MLADTATDDSVLAAAHLVTKMVSAVVIFAIRILIVVTWGGHQTFMVRGTAMNIGARKEPSWMVLHEISTKLEKKRTQSLSAELTHRIFDQQTNKSILARDSSTPGYLCEVEKIASKWTWLAHVLETRRILRFQPYWYPDQTSCINVKKMLVV